MHGGKTPRGFESPHYINGQKSKYLKHLPESLGIRFDNLAASRDEEASVVEEISLTEMHLQQLLEMLSDSTLFENWRQIRRTVAELEELILNPPDEDCEEFFGQAKKKSDAMLFQEIRDLFVHTDKSLRTWDEIRKVKEDLRKFQETNSKIKKEILEREVERKKLVPLKIFHRFVLEVGRQFESSPDDIRKIQMHGLAAAFNLLPPVIRDQPKQISNGE